MKLLFSLLLALSLTNCGKKNDTAKPEAPKATSGNHDAAGPITEEKLGVKIYPGARIVTSGETADIVSANLQTDDAAEKVIKFYEDELAATRSSTSMVKAKKDGRTFVVSIAPSGAGTAVSIMGKK